MLECMLKNEFKLELYSYTQELFYYFAKDIQIALMYTLYITLCQYSCKWLRSECLMMTEESEKV